MPSSRRQQSAEWREFEKLVARIEATLAGTGVTVRSPDRVKSIVTGHRREVDASLRTRVGTAEILVTVECRRRRSAQDVTWIEQLGCKKQAIGAARTIAVASSAFSEAATRAAAFYGVDLRIIREVSAEDISGWPLPQCVVHVHKHCRLTEQPKVGFEPQPNDAFSKDSTAGDSVVPPTGIDAPVFVCPSGERLTLNDVWLRADSQLDFFSTIPTDDKAYNRRINLTVADDLRIETPLGLRRVRRIGLMVALRWRHERIPLSEARLVSYEPVGAPSADTYTRAEFESKEASLTNIRLGIQSQQGSQDMTFSIELLPKPKQ